MQEYSLTWWQSTADGVEAYERQVVGEKAALVQGGPAPVEEDPDDEADVEEEEVASDRRSAILPSYLSRARLDERLRPDAVYVVELAANVDSTEGELRGEAAVLVLRTRPRPAAGPSSTSSTPWSYDPVGGVPDLQIERLPTNQPANRAAAQPDSPPSGLTFSVSCIAQFMAVVKNVMNMNT